MWHPVDKRHTCDEMNGVKLEGTGRCKRNIRVQQVRCDAGHKIPMHSKK